MRNPFYNSWIALTVFIALIIFIPYRVSLLTFKVSDAWLILCLGLQYTHGFNRKINFRNRRFLKNFGIWMGIIAIVATIFQAWHDETPVKPVFFGEFYRFFRYFLIFKFTENIILNSDQKDILRFFNSYTIIGLIVIGLSFLEFYTSGTFQKIILDFYYIVPDQTFDEYIEEFGRLLGVMGNSNTTAIYMVSTLVFPAFSLILKKGKILNRLFLIIYMLFAGFVIIVMTSSRTSIIISILLFVFLFILSFSHIKNFVRFAVIIIISLVIGMLLYNQYSSKIVLADRVTFLFEGKDTRGENAGFIESMGRNKLWQNRYDTFKDHANPAGFLIGMGYTKVYKEYSDNGLLSSYFNNGLIGLLLRLMLYYLVFRYGFWRLFRNYIKQENNYLPLIFGVVSSMLILWEFTADMIEHIKIGQIFYLFLSAGILYGESYYNLGRKKIHQRNKGFSMPKNR